MGYKVVTKLKVAPGVVMAPGAPYAGPQDLIPKLLAAGLIVADESIVNEPEPSLEEEVMESEETATGNILGDLPQPKKRKRKSKEG